MAHTLVIGGQPDWITLPFSTTGSPQNLAAHGREIAAGDAEKTLDLTPSVRYRAASSCSGEFRYLSRNYGIYTRSRGIGGIVHNLADVGAKTRYVIATADVMSQVMPTETVKVSNAEGSVSAVAAVFGDVDQDPYAAITTYATPTAPIGAWYIEVGFDNATALYTGVPDSQTVLVYLRYNGTIGGAEATQVVTIKVKEDDGSPDADDFPVRVTKTLRIRAEDQDTFVTSVLVNPTDFDDATLDDMTVRVSCEGADGASYWEVGAIVWQRQINTGVSVDSGWVAVESTSNDLAGIGDAQICSIHPLLDGSGEVSEQSGDFSYFLLYWDDSIDDVASGQLRIFSNTGAALLDSGVLSDWRPEIGIIAEGPAYGTNTLSFGYTPSWIDPSIVRESKGANLWTIRREPRRRLSVTLDHVSPADYAGELFSVMRRCGMSRPFLVCIKPSPAFNNAVSQAVSIYGRLVGFDSSNMGNAAVGGGSVGDGYWRVSMTFEELT